jgi:hypothetical protein
LELTPNLALLLQYLEDTADKRKDNPNWIILDGLFDPDTGHDHDGTDSPHIHPSNFDELWAAIQELRRLVRELRGDFEAHLIDYRLFKKNHNHDGAITYFMDTFRDLAQTDTAATSAIVRTTGDILTLPANYSRNTIYHWTSKAFDLVPDTWPDPAEPTTAKGSVVMSRRGQVTPYLVTGTALTKTPGAELPYAGMKKGTLLGSVRTEGRIHEKLTFEGKDASQPWKVPHEAMHYYGAADQPGLGFKLPSINEYQRLFLENVPFDQADYDRVAAEDGQYCVTGPKYNFKKPIRRTVNANINPRVLYNSDKALSWDRQTNTFYWYMHDKNVFNQIPNSQIQPLRADKGGGSEDKERLDKIAAGIDRATGEIYVLKTVHQAVEKPKGHIEVWHQIVRWDGFLKFEVGEWFRSGTHKRRYWPASIAVPTRLEVGANLVHLVTELGWDEAAPEERGLVNYYDNGDTQWLPISQVYGDLTQSVDDVGFTLFNPGILGTVLSVPKLSTTGWAPKSRARIIPGGVGLNNSYAGLTPRAQMEFEGVNNQILMGSSDEKLVFYQAFSPHDGNRILAEELYKDPDFRAANPDRDTFHGIVTYNIATGQREPVKTTLPMRVNPGGAVDSGTAYISGGTELVKQFVDKDLNLHATPDNTPPAGKEIIYAFWADRNAPGAKNPEGITERDVAANPLVVNLNTATWERVSTTIEGEEPTIVHYPQLVAHKDGFAEIGGVQIRGRRSHRGRRHDARVRRVVGWTKGLEENARAHQMFWFRVGEVDPEDRITIFYKGFGEGKATFSAPGTPTEDVQVHVWNGTMWELATINTQDNINGAYSMTQRASEVVDTNGEMVVKLSSARKTDVEAKLASKLNTDYIYAMVEKVAYRHEYEWTGMTQGGKAAIVLACSNGAGEINGVEVHSVEAAIDSSWAPA